MKYPIDIERYIASMRLLYGVNEARESIFRAMIPFVNQCYVSGLLGEDGFPLNVEEKSRDPKYHIMADRWLPAMYEWGNQAYAQGRFDAEKGGME